MADLSGNIVTLLNKIFGALARGLTVIGGAITVTATTTSRGGSAAVPGDMAGLTVTPDGSLRVVDTSTPIDNPWEKVNNGIYGNAANPWAMTGD